MGKLRRALALAHLLADSAEGVTLDEMAHALGVNRRTAERLRDALRDEFDIEERIDDRTKRFFIRDRLGRSYTCPRADEVAALEIEVSAKRSQGAGHARPLERLLARVKSGLDGRDKLRLAPDLDALVRLQRSRVSAGPLSDSCPDGLASIQAAILAGRCVDFDYLAESAAQPRWRCAIPYGLVHGPVTYLVGKIAETDRDPVFFRLDRMKNARISDLPGQPPADWDLDEWLGGSFGIWREEDHDIVLRVHPVAVERAKRWHFHQSQVFEEDGDNLVIRFRAGGLREIAEHLFTWDGEIRIDGPEALRTVMRERLDLAATTI